MLALNAFYILYRTENTKMLLLAETLPYIRQGAYAAPWTPDIFSAPFINSKNAPDENKMIKVSLSFGFET